jgi:hypothetical protein
MNNSGSSSSGPILGVYKKGGERPCSTSLSVQSESDKAKGNLQSSEKISGFSIYPPTTLMLGNVSERRRGQILHMATKYVSRCNRDCARLIRELLTISKEQFSKESVGEGRSNDVKRSRVDDIWAASSYASKSKKKRGDSFSESDSDDQDSVHADHRGDSQGQSNKIGEAIPPNNSKVLDVRDQLRSQPSRSRPTYSFLHALLAVVEPSVLIAAKEWIQRKQPREGINSNTNSSTFQTIKSIPVLKSRQQSKEQRETEESYHSMEKSTAQPVAAPSDKHAHSLVFKIEELEWRLLLLVQELQRSSQTQSSRRRKVSKAYEMQSLHDIMHTFFYILHVSILP